MIASIMLLDYLMRMIARECCEVELKEMIGRLAFEGVLFIVENYLSILCSKQPVVSIEAQIPGDKTFARSQADVKVHRGIYVSVASIFCSIESY